MSRQKKAIEKEQDKFNASAERIKFEDENKRRANQRKITQEHF